MTQHQHGLSYAAVAQFQGERLSWRVMNSDGKQGSYSSSGEKKWAWNLASQVEHEVVGKSRLCCKFYSQKMTLLGTDPNSQ